MVNPRTVVLGVDGISDFNALHSGKCNEEVQLYAFDVLAMDDEDLRDLPLSMRKTNLARLLRGRQYGVFIAPFEVVEIGPKLFAAACSMGLEGLVPKRADRRYSAGRSKDWVKMKNRSHPAMERVKESFCVTIGALKTQEVTNDSPDLCRHEQAGW
jgi:bifunctional non-homologous end joining protein LigD